MGKKQVQQKIVQELANKQEILEDCVASKLNLYLDNANGLGNRYIACKDDCFEQFPQLKKLYEQRRMADSNKSEYFDPVHSSACLR